MRKIKDEKLPRAIAIEENYSLRRAFEADELRKERHEFSRAKRVRETQMKKDASACLEAEEGLSADGSRLTF